ncbi:unnamed protein product [Ambrosiozyma monospora]|uniref:Unnamed protein product n=1 Tax=Ambrosiozyma monospora TaxID=43982 RepID=A0ACB5T8R0_AMBMO|nr:unnamed protein product [Ambrosiozyma monospora]
MCYYYPDPTPILKTTVTTTLCHHYKCQTYTFTCGLDGKCTGSSDITTTPTIPPSISSPPPDITISPHPPSDDPSSPPGSNDDFPTPSSKLLDDSGSTYSPPTPDPSSEISAEPKSTDPTSENPDEPLPTDPTSVIVDEPLSTYQATSNSQLDAPGLFGRRILFI